jgi:hypothetical protein
LWCAKCTILELFWYIQIMVNSNDAKRIIDHFHIGKLINFEDFRVYYKVTTNQGTFFILESEPIKGRETEQERSKTLEGIVGPNVRLLLPDYKGELNEYSSYAHYKGKYFSVYKLVE